MTYQVFVLWSSFTFAIYISFVKIRFTFFYISFAQNWNCFWALHTLLTTQRKKAKTLRYFVQKALRLTLYNRPPEEILIITKKIYNRLHKTYFIYQISFSPWANIVKWWNHLVSWFAAAVVGCRRAQSDKRQNQYVNHGCHQRSFTGDLRSLILNLWQ